MTTPEDRPQQPVPGPSPEANPFQPPTAPPVGQQPYPMGAYPVAPPILEEPKRNKGLHRALRIIIPIVVFAIVGIVVRAILSQDSISATKNVGDCLAGNVDNAESVKAADCGPDANYKIVGKVENQSQISMSVGGGCDSFATATVVYWEGHQASNGTLFCLEDTKNPGKGMPQLGECLNGDLSDTAKVTKVPCGPDAAYKVAGVEEGGALGGLTTAVCTKTPTAGASVVWKREGSLSSKVLCLEDVKNPENRRPAIGECMAPGEKDELHLAPCKKGASKVLGQIEGLSSLDGMTKTVEEICKDFPAADQAASWAMQGSLAATTYCLQSVKK